MNLIAVARYLALFVPLLCSTLTDASGYKPRHIIGSGERILQMGKGVDMPPGKGKGAEMPPGKGKGGDMPEMPGKGKGAEMPGKGLPAKGKGSSGKKAGYDIYHIEYELDQYLDGHQFSFKTLPPVYKGKGKGAPIYYAKGKGSSGKGKGGSKSAKKSKKDGPAKGKGYYPSPVFHMPVTEAPSTAISGAPVSSADAVTAPTQMPNMDSGSNSQQSVTDPPTTAGPFVQTSRFQLVHTLAQDVSGGEQDKWNTLAATTGEYLDDFFSENFASPGSSSVFSYNKAVTTRVGGTNTMHVYDCEIHFFPSSRVPPKEDLDNAVQFAFVTEIGEYLEWLEENLENEYSGTTAAAFGWAFQAAQSSPSPPPVVQSSEKGDADPDLLTEEEDGNSESSTAGVAAGAAGAGAFMLMIGAFMIVRRGRNRGDAVGKFLDEGDGHITLAGETYAGETYTGETYAGGSSLGDAQSEMHRTGGVVANREMSTTSSVVGDHHDAYGHHNDDASVKSASSATNVGAADWNEFQRVLHPDPMAHPEYDDMSEALSRGRSHSETFESHPQETEYDEQHEAQQYAAEPLEPSRLSNVREVEEESFNDEDESGDMYSEEYDSPEPESSIATMRVDHTQLQDVQL